MKAKSLVFGFFCMLTVSISSCNKDWTCTCTDGNALPIDNAKKSDAEDACSQYQMIVQRTTATATCKL